MRLRLIVLGTVLVLGLSATHAATYVVNSPGDEPDANPGDGICSTGGSNGVCTLRAAIEEVNASATTNNLEIFLVGGSPITLTSDLPEIIYPVTILGSGEIDGGGHAGLVLIGGSSTVQDVTIHDCLNGIELRELGGNLIFNCKIGTDPSGFLPLGNVKDGVLITNCTGNAIEGTASVISDNGGDGVHIVGAGSAYNDVQFGIFIGTDVTGSNAMPNAGHGVHIEDAPTNSVGGIVVVPQVPASILIAGNTGYGILIEGAGAVGNQVTGIFIGTDPTGSLPLANVLGGVHIASAPSNVVEGVLCSGNDGPGIQIDGATALGNRVLGCFVGAGFTTNALGNNGAGIVIAGDASGTSLWDDLIAFNNGAGVRIDSGTRNFIGPFLGQPAIFGNFGLGIDLGHDGVTTNDAQDTDIGPNNLQNFPVLTSVAVTPTSTVVQGNINSTAFTLLELEFYANDACDPSGFGQGQQLIGSAGVFTDGSGNATFSVTNPVVVASGRFITATAADFQNNTSEFSHCLVVPGGPGADLAVSVVPHPDPVTLPLQLIYTITVMNNGSSLATNIVLTDTLSTNVLFDSASTGCSESTPGTVTCNLGNLASGDFTNVDITTISATAGLVTNRVTVTSGVPDPDLSNNSETTVSVATDSGPAKLKFSADSYTVDEGAGHATISVVRSGDLSGSVSVHVASSDIPAAQGGATAGADYTPVATTLQFDPGVTQVSFQVTIIDDAKPEDQESLNLVLSAPTGGATLGGRSSAVLFIEDNEPPIIGFGASAVGTPFYLPLRPVTEDSGDQVAMVIRRGRTDLAVAVDFQALDGNAHNGTDYVVTANTLSFAAGEVSKSLPFHILPRAGYQGDRVFYLQLLNPQPVGVVKVRGSTLPVVIFEDEPPATPQTTASLTLPNGTTVGAKLGGAGSLLVTPASTAAAAKASRVEGLAGPAPDIDIVVSGADPTTALTLTAKAGAGGSPQVNIGSLVAGGGLKSINGKAANIVGKGILLGGPLGSLTIHDILNGAAVVAGGTSNQTTTIKAHVIGDNTQLSFGSAIASLSAASIGQCTILAPSLGGLSIKGDKTAGVPGNCEADLELSGDGVAPGALTLGKVAVAGAISNALFNISGSIGSVAAGQIIDSLIAAGFTVGNPTNTFAGGGFVPGLKINSVATKAAANSLVDSVIAAAQVGAVKLSSLQTNNTGHVFGVLANESVGAVSSKTPLFKWNPAGAADQSLGDFHVKH